MQPSDTMLAYLAGVIDSDGYISIQRVMRKGKPYHCAIVGIAGTRRDPHDLAASIWGGKVSAHTPKNKRHRIQFNWQRAGRSAVPVIKAILPFLMMKVQQADIALECEVNLDDERNGGDDPFPCWGPDYDPRMHRDLMRLEIIEHLNQGRRMPFSRPS